MLRISAPKTRIPWIADPFCQPLLAGSVTRGGIITQKTRKTEMIFTIDKEKKTSDRNAFLIKVNKQNN